MWIKTWDGHIVNTDHLLDIYTDNRKTVGTIAEPLDCSFIISEHDVIDEITDALSKNKTLITVR